MKRYQFIILLLVVFVGSFIGGFAAERLGPGGAAADDATDITAGNITARSLTIIGADDQPSVKLSAADGWPLLMMRETNSLARIIIGVTAAGPVVSVTKDQIGLNMAIFESAPSFSIEEGDGVVWQAP